MSGGVFGVHSGGKKMVETCISSKSKHFEQTDMRACYFITPYWQQDYMDYLSKPLNGETS